MIPLEIALKKPWYILEAHGHGLKYFGQPKSWTIPLPADFQDTVNAPLITTVTIRKFFFWPPNFHIKKE